MPVPLQGGPQLLGIDSRRFEVSIALLRGKQEISGETPPLPLPVYRERSKKPSLHAFRLARSPTACRVTSPLPLSLRKEGRRQPPVFEHTIPWMSGATCSPLTILI